MPQPRYRNLSLPDEFVKEIEKFIEEHPELGFSSMADFIKYAVRAYIEFRNALLTHREQTEEF